MRKYSFLAAIVLITVMVFSGCKPTEPEQPQTPVQNFQTPALTEILMNTAIPEPSVEPDTDTRDLSEKVADAIQQYCPDGTFIISKLIEKAQTSPYNNGADFLGGTKRWTDMFQSAGTYDTVFGAAGVIVHEETHSLQSLDWASHYVNGEQLIIRDDVLDFFSTDEAKSIPKSEIIAPYVQANLQTARFANYVAPGVQVGGNSNGLLGLIREFEAYHMEARTTYDLLKMLKARPVRANEYFDCFVGLNNRADAFYEFTFFITKYMIVLREKDSEWYNRLLERKGLWVAFGFHYEKYKALVDIIPDSYSDLCTNLIEAGYDAELTGDALEPSLRIGNETKASNNDVRVLIDEMKKAEYSEMLELLLSLG